MNVNMQVGELFVTLNLLNFKDKDIPHAKKGKELGHVTSMSVVYGLNMIPTATVSVPLGSVIRQNGSTSPSYVYGGSADSLYKLGDDSTPVGIYVRGSFFDTTGGSSVQEYCIFKGYITDSFYERSSGSASMAIKLIHWLCHLTEFPMVSSLLSPNTPSDIAAQYPLAVTEKTVDDLSRPSDNGVYVKFSPVGATVSLFNDISSGANIWDGLKLLFKNINPNPSELTKEDPGYVSKQYLERVTGALEAVVGADLDFFPKVSEDFGRIKQSIAAMLGSLSCGYFNGSTIWDKMINTFLPGFYMSLTPRVCEANVIPSPGQCMGIAKVKRISKAEYYQTSYSRISAPTLFGGVILYNDPGIYHDVISSRTSIRFPEKLQPGPLQVVTAPAWLEKGLVPLSGDNIVTTEGFYISYKNSLQKRKEDKAKEKKDENDVGDTVKRILDNLVRVTYQMVACSGRQISITTPFRLDITAGEVLGIELPSGVVEAKQEYIYGTVDSVTININTGSASTTLVLSNIRTQKEMKNKDLTSSEGILYSKSWKSNSKLILCEKIK